MRAIILAGLCSLAWGCVDGPAYLYGERITGKTFAPLGATVGVHPDQSVLRDPENPFANTGVGAETRWEIEAYGDPVAAFYSWATLLAFIPIGEHQFYAGLNLQRIFQEGRAAPDDLPAVRALAIAAFQAVLDEFPESVTFDATGTIGYGLATPAYEGIVELGGVPRGGWTLVATADGGRVAVKTSDIPLPEEAP